MGLAVSRRPDPPAPPQGTRPLPRSGAGSALLVGCRGGGRTGGRAKVDVSGLQHVLGLIVLYKNYHGQVGAVDLVFLGAELERLAAMALGLVLVELLPYVLANGLQFETGVEGALAIGVDRVAFPLLAAEGADHHGV